MNKMILSALGGLAILVSTQAQALTIDLNLTSQSGFAGPSYSQDGYTLTNAGSGSGSLSYGNWLTVGAPSFNANGSNATLFQNYSNTSNTLTSDAGTPFSFQGISLANVYNTNTGGVVSFVFNYVGGGSSSQTVTLANQTGLQAFAFDQTDLSSVVFTGLTTQFLQFDLIKVGGAISAAPEPATWAMMIIGFGLVGCALRRRSAVKTTITYA